MTDTQRRAVARLGGLDRVRGAAVVAMLVDHSAFLAGVPWLRLTVGRAAMPAFAVCVGAVAVRPLSRRRAWQWAGAAVLYPLVHVVAFGTWRGADLLAVLLVARVLVVRARAVAVALAGSGVVAWANGWVVFGAYDPLAVVCLVLVGRAAAQQVEAAGVRCFPGWFERLGRRSLGLYVGHVAAMALWASW